MQTTLYYFTGTGNSLAVARKLAAKIGACTIIPITKYLNTTRVKPDSTRIGFVFPNHFASVPDLVRDFINKLDMQDVEYTFTVFTSAGATGHITDQVRQLLAAKSTTLNYAAQITLPGNYIWAWYYKIANQSPRNKAKTYKKADRAVSKIAEQIINGINHLPGPDVWSRMFASSLVKHKMENDYSAMDKHYYTHNNCNACGTCARVCPVANITITDKKVRWNHNCQVCMACIQLCPKQAIQYNHKTEKKARYHNPEISLHDLVSRDTD